MLVLFVSEIFPQKKIVISLRIRCDNTTLEVYRDTVFEGTKYFVKPKTLQAPFASAQQLYDAFVSSYFYFDNAALNQDIFLRFTFDRINCQTGQFIGDPLNSASYFLNYEFRVFDIDALNPLGSPFNFNAGKFFNLVFKKTPQFNSWLSNLGISNAPDSLGFFYLSNGVYTNQGLQIPINNNDSIVVRMAHFSSLIGTSRSRITVDAKEEMNSLPSTFSLSQNFPNPFNPTTLINYSVPKESFVEIKVFNILGIEVATIVSEKKGVGNYSVEFDGYNLSSGIYIYKIKSADYFLSRKMTLIK